MNNESEQRRGVLHANKGVPTWRLVDEAAVIAFFPQLSFTSTFMAVHIVDDTPPQSDPESIGNGGSKCEIHQQTKPQNHGTFTNNGLRSKAHTRFPLLDRAVHSV
jgi:hypothetical protein